MADEIGTPTPTPTPGGENPQYIKGDEQCNSDDYFCSVCETGFVDPVAKHTIVEAAATLNDCEVCCNAREVREAVDAINELLDNMNEMSESYYSSNATKYFSCSGGSDQQTQSTSYADITIWDGLLGFVFSMIDGTEVAIDNVTGSCRTSCKISVKSAGGTSSCTLRMMYDDGTGYIPLTMKKVTTTETVQEVELWKILNIGGSSKFKMEIKDNEVDSHNIVTSTSTWNFDLITS